MKERVSLGLCVVATLLFIIAGCHNEEIRENEVVVANFRDLRDLNPHLYAGEMFAQAMLFESLVRVSDSGYEPNLAYRWDISEDGCVYTFYLREDVVFSDHEPFNAYVVEANFDAILENKERHTWLESVQHMESANAIDEFVFQITLSKPYYPLLTELGVIRPFAMVSPQAMKEGSTKDGLKEWIGTGPYLLVEHVVDEYAVFEVNEHYWGESPQVDRIVIRVIPDNQSRIMALRNGEIDLIYGKNLIDANTIVQFREQEEFVVDVSAPTSTRQILMNTTHEILNDVRVRQAIMHATDRVAISQGVFFGIEQPADTLFDETVPYANINLTSYSYDLDRATLLLDEAGWLFNDQGYREKEGELLTLELLYNVNSVSEQWIAEFLQSEYRKLGIQLDIHGEEEQSYRDLMKTGNFDLTFNITWGAPYDPQSTLGAMTERVYGDYLAQQGIPNKEEIDEAILKVLSVTEGSMRQELYTFVLTELHEQVVYLPLTYENNKAIYHKDLGGVVFLLDQFRIPFEKMYWK